MWVLVVGVYVHGGLHHLQIHLISGSRPQARGINCLFDLLLFSPILPLLSFLPFPLYCVEKLSVHININRALNIEILRTNCPF